MNYRIPRTMKPNQKASLVTQMRNICKKMTVRPVVPRKKVIKAARMTRGHAALHCMLPSTLFSLSDPFVDQHLGTVLVLTEDFSGIHSDVPRSDMSALNCFQLFMSDEVVESLCLWSVQPSISWTTKQ